MSDGGTRREFLRGLLGRTRHAASRAPDAPAKGPPAVGTPPPKADGGRPAAAPHPLTPEEMERAFGVPADQRDIAEVLLRLGHLAPAPDGRYVARRDIAHPPAGYPAVRAAPPIGPASTAWLDRARRGRAPDRARPTDAAIIQAARTELMNR